MEKTFAGASFSEAAIATGAGVLAILGLVGVLPHYMTAVATIALGASLLVEGLGLASRMKQLQELARTRYETTLVGGGISTEVAAGVAGIALGILALVGIVPTVLVAVAAIVFGGGLIFGGSTEIEIERLLSQLGDDETGGKTVRVSVEAVSGADVLVGIGAATLGILALSGVEPVTVLVLVAQLAVAAALTLSGSALGAQMGMAARR
ncbi:MAG: hypothetical protein PVF57_05900 [Pseudomonadales bacterium]|jgi:hypothetical protein